MKPVMTLIMAVVVHSICFAQAGGPVAGGPAGGSPDAGGPVAAKGAPPAPLEFPVAIDAILQDFRFNLRHITGELLLAQGEFENYPSLIAVPDAENCIVTKYHSTE